MSELMPPTFWQFVRDRYGRMLLFPVCWTITCACALIWLPHWVLFAMTGTLFLFFAFESGQLYERQRKRDRVSLMLAEVEAMQATFVEALAALPKDESARAVAILKRDAPKDRRVN